MHRNDPGVKSLRRGNIELIESPQAVRPGDTDSIISRSWQEILRANAYVKTAADLALKYRKNVQYNLEANKPEEGQ